MARELLIADRTASPPGEGLKSYADTTAGKTTVYDKTDTRPVISPVAQAMLIKFGSLVSAKSGAVRLVKLADGNNLGNYAFFAVVHEICFEICC
jgi:hypothetical protein